MSRNFLRILIKVQSFVIISACSIFFLVQSYGIYHSFIQQETGTRVTIESFSKVSLPDITLCLQNGYKSKALIQNGIGNEFKYWKQWSSNDSSKTPSDVFDEVTYDLKDMITGFSVVRHQPEEKKTIKDLQNICKNVSLITYKNKPFFGKCLTISIPVCFFEDEIAEPDCIKFYIDTDRTSWLYFHSKNSFHYTDMKTDEFYYKTMSKKSRYNFRIKHSVDIRKKECVDILDQDDCFYENVYIKSMKVINCTVPWLPNKKKHICTNTSNAEIAFGIYDNIRKQVRKVCPRACKNMYLDIDCETNNTTNPKIEVVLHWNKFVTVSEEYFLNNEMTLLANIGGYLGLTLGISIASLKDVFKLLLESIYSRIFEPTKARHSCFTRCKK